MIWRWPSSCLDLMPPLRSAPALVRVAMLFHVVLAGEGLVALGANGVFVAGVLLGVARCVAIGGEEVVAVFLLGERARILALLGAAAR